MTFVHTKISENAQLYGSAPAIILDGRAISYQTVENAVLNGMKWLAGENVTHGTVVALSLSDAVLQLYLTLALFRMGAIQATLDPRLPAANFRSLAAKLGVQLVVQDFQPARMVSVTAILAPGREALETSLASHHASCDMSGESVALLFHGSGTTGDPKIIGVPHRQLHFRCSNLADDFPLSPGDRSMILQRHTTPTYLTRAIQSLFFAGCLIEVSSMRNGTGNYFESMCNAIDQNRVDHLSCTAFHAKSIVNKLGGSQAKIRFPHLKTFLVGASPVSLALRETVLQRVTPNLCINYGTNETGTIARASPAFLTRHFDSVGSIFPNTEVTILDPSGKRLADGQQGMIAVKGNSVISRYEGEEAANKSAFHDGWYRTGDLGYLSGEGALYVLGRYDDMLIVDGTNVFPAEIEKVIDSLAAVKESAVIGIYSDLGRDTIAAFVVLRQRCTEAFIMGACKQQLGWKSPHQIFFVETLPRNFAGKVLRKELAKLITVATV